MKKALATFAIAIATITQASAFTVPFEIFLGTGDEIENSGDSTPFTGFLSIGTFAGSSPNFGSDTFASLAAAFKPFNNGLTYFNTAPLAPGTPVTVTGGTFADQLSLSANFISDGLDGAIYESSYDNETIFALFHDNAAIGASTSFGILQTNKTFKDLDVFVPSGNPDSTIPVSLSIDTVGNSTQVRDGGVALVPEPTIGLLAGLSLLGLGLRRSRQAA